jgi:hypothetical protein
MSDQTKDPSGLAAGKSGQLVPSSKGGYGTVVRSVLFCDLQPLRRPRPDPALLTMPSIERAAYALWYNLLLCEYRLGSNGWLRAWIFSTLRVLLFLLVPLVGFLILVSVLIPTMAGIAQIFHSFAEACHSLLWACIYLLLTMLVIAGAIAFLGAVLPAVMRRRFAR